MPKRQQGLSFRKQKKQINVPLIKEVAIWILEIAIVVFMAACIVYLFGIKTTIIGRSMEATLDDGDEVLMDRFIYNIKNPKRGDVVVFLPNGNEKSHYYVRRVVAVPGDEVYVKEGILYVNDSPSTVFTENITEPGLAEKTIFLAEEEFFVLGDNLSGGEDSRYANLGNIKKDDIKGRVWLKVNSFKDYGFVK